MKAMIFAAGLGTRLKPITDSIPKALLPLNGKTLLQYQIEKLRAAGITDIVINVHHFPEQIMRFCDENGHFGVNIQFSDESDALLETGGGLKKAEACIMPTSEPILVCNVDVLSNIDINALLRAHQPNSLATIVVSPRTTQRYFLFDEIGNLRGWTNTKTGEIRPASIEKENITNLQKLAFSGMHVVSPRIFQLMRNWPDKFSIVDFYLTCLDQHQIHAFIPQDYRMMDVGKIDHLQEAERFAESL